MPLVSIVILSYQRKDTLRRCLEHTMQQVFPDLEIVVADNASNDGAAEMVETEFPLVRLVRLKNNIGCAARNAGVAAATGPIVITLDNDVLLTTPFDAQKVVNLFAENPAVGCINFRIANAEGKLSTRDWCHPRDWRSYENQEFFTNYILEGASAFRRDAFLQVGGYWEPFFIGHEGLDLALRFLNAGYHLLYSPRVTVTHLVSADVRPSSRIYYTFTRNSLWVALRNHRPVAAAWSIIKDLLLMSFSSARAGHLRNFFRGLGDGVKGALRALASRDPLRPATYRQLRQIKAFEPSLFDKAKRHWHEQPI